HLKEEKYRNKILNAPIKANTRHKKTNSLEKILPLSKPKKTIRIKSAKSAKNPENLLNIFAILLMNIGKQS
ncbi:MAG: hypothetical protein ACKO1R_08300, partial [Crocinitomicaceae bacterium]